MAGSSQLDQRQGSLGIVVLAYGSAQRHGPLLAGLLAEGVLPATVLVVHNPADPREPIAAAPPGCEVLRAPRNLGYAAGMNLGIAWQRRRGASLLLLLTHDARLRPGALGALLRAAEAAPDLGALGPVLLLEGNEEPFSFGGFTRPDGANWHQRVRPAAGADGIAACDWVDGGAILLRGEALDQVGCFDERFWGYCEEADLCLRLRRAGYRVAVALDAVAYQDPGGSKRPGAWSYLLTRNGAEYARRAVGLRGALAIEARALWIVAFSLARVAVRTVRRRPGGVREPWAIAAGTAWGALDFLRRRWGPPPARLPGTGDVSNA